jgi:hypothetical protein
MKINFIFKIKIIIFLLFTKTKNFITNKLIKILTMGFGTRFLIETLTRVNVFK